MFQPGGLTSTLLLQKRCVCDQPNDLRRGFACCSSFIGSLMARALALIACVGIVLLLQLAS